MTGYYLFLKLKAGLRELKNPLKLLLFLILALVIGLYSWLFSTFCNLVLLGEVDALTIEQLMNYFLAVLGFVTLARMIVPTYKRLMPLLPQIYPITHWQQYIFALASDYFRPFFLYSILFIVGSSAFLNEYNTTFLVSGILVLFTTQLIRRMIQTVVEFRLKKPAYLILIPLAGLLALFFLNLNASNLVGWMGILYVFLLVISGYYFEINHIERKQNKATKKSKEGWVYLKLIVRNPKARVPLLVGFFLKMIIMGGDFYLFTTKGEHILNGEFLYWIFVSPLVIFTYIFNNTWGFWKAIWLNTELRSGSAKELMRQNLRLLTIPLLVDFVITVPILLLSWDNPGFIVIFYLTSTMLLIPLSFIWSTLTPRQINSTFQMKGSTSPISLFITGGVVMLLTLMLISDWFYFLIPIYFILGGFSIYIAQLYYDDWKHIVARKLRK